MATNTKKKTVGRRKSKSGKNSAKKRAVAIALAVICIILATVGIIIKHNSSAPSPYEFSGGTAYGIDISSHNGRVNWKAVSKEVDFAFIRVGCRAYAEGEIFLDKRAKYNMKNAEKAELPFGVYIYSQAISEKEAEEEAKFLLKHIKGYNVQLPLVIDFEYPTKDGKRVGRLANADLKRKERTAIINAFCKTVSDAGYTPAVYASSSIYKTEISPKKLEKGTVIWVADYNKKVTYGGHYDIWQFSEKGKCKGVSSKYVDTNYWYTEDKNEEN